MTKLLGTSAAMLVLSKSFSTHYIMVSKTAAAWSNEDASNNKA